MLSKTLLSGLFLKLNTIMVTMLKLCASQGFSTNCVRLLQDKQEDMLLLGEFARMKLESVAQDTLVVSMYTSKYVAFTVVSPLEDRTHPYRRDSLIKYYVPHFCNQKSPILRISLHSYAILK